MQTAGRQEMRHVAGNDYKLRRRSIAYPVTRRRYDRAALWRNGQWQSAAKTAGRTLIVGGDEGVEVTAAFLFHALLCGERNTRGLGEGSLFLGLQGMGGQELRMSQALLQAKGNEGIVVLAQAGKHARRWCGVRIAQLVLLQGQRIAVTGIVVLGIEQIGARLYAFQQFQSPVLQSD